MSDMRLTVLILGGYGSFGGRLARLLADEERLTLRRWSVFGTPLPLAFAPRGDTYEYAEDGRFHFHVEINHPWTGLIVGYQGWLVLK